MLARKTASLLGEGCVGRCLIFSACLALWLSCAPEWEMAKGAGPLQVYEGSGAQEAALLPPAAGERGKRAGGKVGKRAEGSSLQLGIRQDLGRLGRYKKNLREAFSLGLRPKSILLWLLAALRLCNFKAQTANGPWFLNPPPLSCCTLKGELVKTQSSNSC